MASSLWGSAIHGFPKNSHEAGAACGAEKVSEGSWPEDREKIYKHTEEISFKALWNELLSKKPRSEASRPLSVETRTILPPYIVLAHEFEEVELNSHGQLDIRT